MSDVPMELVVAAFADEDGASQALKELKEIKKEKLIDIKDAAVIQRGADNKLRIRETGDMGPGKGAVVGGVVGGVLGLLTPPGMLVVAGAAIGALAAKLRDSGFPDERLRELGEALKPGTSALVAVIEHKWVAEVERELERYGARMVTEEIKAEIAAQLEAEEGVPYAAEEEARLEPANEEPAVPPTEASMTRHPEQEQPSPGS